VKLSLLSHYARRITLVSVLLASFGVGLLQAPASATLADADRASLNPGPLAAKIPAGSTKITCPNWADCYEVTTRFLKVRIKDPSELGGDEIYALPMWGILDGMGLDPDPNADGTKDFFRVNITNATWRPWDRGSNLGSQFYQRKTNTWIPLFERSDSARHAKNFVFTDRVIPMSGKQFTASEGLLFTNNFVEHDNSTESATDRLYVETAKDFQGQLQRNSTVGRAKVRQATYGLEETLSAAGTYINATLPDIAKVVAAVGSEGATLLKKDGQPNISNLINSTKNLVSSWMQIDGDDPGEQITTFIPFRELATPSQLGKEQTFVIRGKTDPDDVTNSGIVEAVIGVKLTKVKAGSGKPPWINLIATSTARPTAASVRPSASPRASTPASARPTATKASTLPVVTPPPAIQVSPTPTPTRVVASSPAPLAALPKLVGNDCTRVSGTQATATLCGSQVIAGSNSLTANGKL